MWGVPDGLAWEGWRQWPLHTWDAGPWPFPAGMWPVIFWQSMPAPAAGEDGATAGNGAASIMEHAWAETRHWPAVMTAMANKDTQRWKDFLLTMDAL